MTKPWQDKDTLEEAYKEHKTQEKTADALGCSSSTISRWMDRFDLEAEDYRKKQVKMTITPKGYEAFASPAVDREGTDSFLHHRLIMVAEEGIEAVEGMDVNHINGKKRDNRPENLELVEHSEHARKHHEQGLFERNEQGQIIGAVS